MICFIWLVVLCMYSFNFVQHFGRHCHWTTALLSWLDFHQTQSNLYRWFRTQRHDLSSLSHSSLYLLHWEPAAAGSRHWCFHIEQPQAQHYFHSLLQIYIPSRSLRSTSDRHLVVPSLSRTLTFIASYHLPNPVQSPESLRIQAKTSTTVGN